MKEFKSYLRKNFIDVEVLTNHLMELAINDHECQGHIWLLLKDTGEDYYSKDVFRELAMEILMSYE